MLTTCLKLEYCNQMSFTIANQQNGCSYQAHGRTALYKTLYTASDFIGRSHGVTSARLRRAQSQILVPSHVSSIHKRAQLSSPKPWRKCAPSCEDSVHETTKEHMEGLPPSKLSFSHTMHPSRYLTVRPIGWFVPPLPDICIPSHVGSKPSKRTASPLTARPDP